MLSSNTSGVSEDANYIESVFSTYLYTGNGSTQTITNNIDLSTKGGLVWIKSRSGTYPTGYHCLNDTVRGAQKDLFTNTTGAQSTNTTGLTAFTSSGFSVGSTTDVNGATTNFASWTFREQAKFFDVVTYTGNETIRTIAHNLGSVPGCILIKRTSSTADWVVYHRSTGPTKFLRLNTTGAAATDVERFNDTAPTSTEFTLGIGAGANGTGETYVAYIFAHDAGGFGLTGTDNVISCGSFTGSTKVNLGYEPQLILYKTTNTTGDWSFQDNMRGMTADGNAPFLRANSSAAEVSTSQWPIDSTGFTPSAGGNTYIYIAIRRGPMKVPTDATKVFAPLARTGTGSTYSVTSLSFPPDLIHSQSRDAYGANAFYDRLRGGSKILFPNATGAEGTDASISSFDQNGFSGSGGADYANNVGTPYVFHAMRRAPSFFDEVCFSGNYSATSYSHNLAAVPEMIIIKKRTGTSDWPVYHIGVPSPLVNQPNLNTTVGYSANNWFSSTPTSSVFSTQYLDSGTSNYVAYLFATCAGVSKVFNYTGNGSSQTINCGFTGGARWIMIKRTDSTGDWYIWDSSRGIVSGNDPHLSLNTTAAEVTSDDTIDTDSTGFIVNQLSATNVNVTSATYIGIAIA